MIRVRPGFKNLSGAEGLPGLEGRPFVVVGLVPPLSEENDTDSPMYVIRMTDDGSEARAYTDEVFDTSGA